MTTNTQTIESCDRLLRGELSAIETYSQAIHKFPDAASIGTLERIRKSHLESAASLRSLVAVSGGDPSTNSGVWGGFAMAVEGAAALLGESPALAILKQGEKHGIGEYEDVIGDSDVMDDVKTIIREKLLPCLHMHLIDLDRLR